MKPLFLAVTFLISSNVIGQLNGSYSIGALPSDYLTITDAVTDLNNLGVSGAVVFNIKAGVYIESDIHIGLVAGVSNMNQVTFKSELSNPSDVIINGSSIFALDAGAHYLNFRYLTFDVNFPLYKVAFSFQDFSIPNIQITNCVFTGGTASSAAVFNSLGPVQKRRNVYILCYGGSDILISNNEFHSHGCSFYKENNASNYPLANFTFSDNLNIGISGYALNIYALGNFNISNNMLQGTIDGYSFYLNDFSGNGVISGNQIYSTIKGGIWLESTNVSGNVTVKNNFLSTPDWPGLIVSCDSSRIVNNSFYSGNGRCLSIIETSPMQSVGLFNNLFSCKEGFGNITLSQNLNLSTLNSNNNAFNKINRVVAQYGVSDYSLSEWVTYSSLDGASKYVGDIYSTMSDLHTPNAILLDGEGMALTDVLFDIDGQPRNPTMPDIGADEFTMNFSTYLDVELSLSNPNASCSSSDTLPLAIINNCLTVIDSFQIATTINDLEEVLQTYYITILPGDTATVPLTNWYFRENTFYEKISCQLIAPNGLLDNNQINNHAELVDVFRLGAFEILRENEDYRDCSNDVRLTVPEFPNCSITWSTNESSWWISVNNPGIYTATITTLNGCQATETIIID